MVWVEAITETGNAAFSSIAMTRATVAWTKTDETGQPIGGIGIGIAIGHEETAWDIEIEIAIATT